MLQNVTIAESVWQQLSDKDQGIILRAAEEAKARERQLVAEETDLCVARLQELGMEINYPDLVLFTEATENLRREETKGYKEDYERVKEWLANHADCKDSKG
jgi:TRAP-type C4-dicarboxylate transport system substrate-binding protein